MPETVIQIKDLSKSYRLGVIGGKRLVDDLSRQWAKLRGKPDPLAKVTQASKQAEGQISAPSSEEIWALKDISLDVKQGEVLGIIGRNGAGKSTLLKILSRVTAPTSGEVRVKGRIASLLEVGTGFHPELTGRENVFLNGAILGMTQSEIRKRFDEIVAFSDIEKFIDTPVKRYSSGMTVRLAFAVAAHLEAEIMIIDEVLAVGDAAFQEKCLGKIERVAGQGRTVLFVSHNMSSIQQLCKGCVLLRGGEIERIGEPAQVVGDYLSDSREGSDVDISDWKDRKNSGEGRLVRLSMTNQDGQQTATFRFGESVTFHLDAEINRPLFDPSFGVIVHTAAGEPLIHLQSIHDGMRVGRAQGRVQVQAQFPNIGLYPGRYFISLWLASDGRDIDTPKMCGHMQVLPNTGEWGDLKFYPKLGKYHVSSKWSVSD